MEGIIKHIVFMCSIYDCFVVYRYVGIVNMYVYKCVHLTPLLYALIYSLFIQFTNMQNLHLCPKYIAVRSHVSKFFGTKSYINPVI